MLLPLALLQFIYSLKILEDDDRKIQAKLVTVTVLSLLVKPNFFLCYAAVFPLFLFGRCGWRLNKRFFYGITHIVIGGVVLFLELLVTYTKKDNGVGIAFSPFVVWDHFTGSKTICLLTSF